MPLRGVGFIYSSMAETPCYIILTYLVLRKYAKTTKEIVEITGVILLGRIILEIPIRIIDFGPTLMSLPSTLLSCLTILLTALSFATKKIYIYILSLAIWSYCTFFGHKALLYYMTWGPELKAQVSTLKINTSDGITALKNIESKYILLDFWSSKCGFCYKKFPELQALYEKKYDNMTIASVFVPYQKEQISDGKSIIDKLGYTFPVWSVSPQDTLLNVLKINGYPTIILLDEKRNVIFRGNLERAKKKMEDLID